MYFGINWCLSENQPSKRDDAQNAGRPVTRAELAPPDQVFHQLSPAYNMTKVLRTQHPVPRV